MYLCTYIGETFVICRNLLVKESPEDWEGQEHVGDGLEGFDVVDEVLAVLFLGIVQHRLLLLRLATGAPLLECVLFTIRLSEFFKSNEFANCKSETVKARSFQRYAQIFFDIINGLAFIVPDEFAN
jgi:hypothetical protein